MVKMKLVIRSWGSEYWWAQEPEYRARVLILQRGKTTLLHCHEKKKETLCLWSGSVLLELEDKKYKLVEGSVVTILPGQKHRIKAIHNHSVILEASTSELDKIGEKEN